LTKKTARRSEPFDPRAVAGSGGALRLRGRDLSDAQRLRRQRLHVGFGHAGGLLGGLLETVVRVRRAGDADLTRLMTFSLPAGAFLTAVSTAAMNWARASAVVASTTLATSA
jgi:hypothetical protein